MNIGQMMRNLLGDATSSEARAMELKVGQVVRGVVMQVLDNNEAIVQINGVQVRAKLEMALQAGQSAMLQVQPQSNGALVLLKQIDPSEAGLLDDTFRDFAKLLGLPDQKWALNMVKDLRREGFTFNRETAQAFQQAAAAMPSGANAEEWMQAAAAAFKRGLPMTAATVSSMQQIMFGRDAHELLANLQRQLGAFSEGGSSTAAGDSKPLSQAATRVLALLAEGSALLRGAMAVSDGTVNTAAATSSTASQQASAASVGVRADVLQSQIAQQAPASTAFDASRAAVFRPAESSNWLGQMMKWLGVDHEHQLAKAVSAREGQSAQAASLQQNQQSNHSTRSGVNAEVQVQGQLQAQSANSASSALVVPQSSGQVGALATAVVEGNGAAIQQNTNTDHSLAGEQRPAADRASIAASNAAAQAASNTSAQTSPERLIVEGIQTQQPAQSVQPQQLPQDTLKSALLSLIAADDTPPAIRETAQQLVQQITGQQLLLTSERNSSLFTHVTMFIPLNDKDGSQTASVHIQTRRGRKGELDADNCRLLFNLSMQTLGDTLVDVHVTDKIVSLNLWNDHPAISELAEVSRADISERLQETGYQLLSLRTTPLPKTDEPGEQSTTLAKQPQPPNLAQFTSTRYKGVDYRI